MNMNHARFSTKLQVLLPLCVVLGPRADGL